MRILHIIPSMHPSGGGPPRVASRIAASQCIQGHDVAVLCRGSKDDTQQIQTMAEYIPGFERVHLRFVEDGTSYRLLTDPDVRCHIARSIDACDVLHFHGVWEFFLCLCGRFARKSRKPYFVQPNGMLDAWALQQKRFKKRLGMLLGRRTFWNAAEALLLGNETERQYVDSLSLAVRTIVEPLNAIFPEEVQNLPENGTAYRMLHQLRGRPYIVFMGRLHYKKGLDLLARAFIEFVRHNARTDLVVIGHDEGSMNSFLHEVSSAGVQSRVHLVGAQHGPAKWALLRDARCFVLPSRQEGFSIAITEALACSVPCIISQACHFHEAANAGAAIEVELSATQIANALRKVCADDSLYASMSSAAYKLVSEHYNSRVVGQKLVQHYAQACKIDSCAQ